MGQNQCQKRNRTLVSNKHCGTRPQDKRQRIYCCSNLLRYSRAAAGSETQCAKYERVTVSSSEMIHKHHHYTKLTTPHTVHEQTTQYELNTDTCIRQVKREAKDA